MYLEMNCQSVTSFWTHLVTESLLPMHIAFPREREPQNPCRSTAGWKEIINILKVPSQYKEKESGFTMPIVALN